MSKLSFSSRPQDRSGECSCLCAEVRNESVGLNRVSQTQTKIHLKQRNWRRKNQRPWWTQKKNLSLLNDSYSLLDYKLAFTLYESCDSLCKACVTPDTLCEVVWVKWAAYSILIPLFENVHCNNYFKLSLRTIIRSV